MMRCSGLMTILLLAAACQRSVPPGNTSTLPAPSPGSRAVVGQDVEQRARVAAAPFGGVSSEVAVDRMTLQTPAKSAPQTAGVDPGTAMPGIGSTPAAAPPPPPARSAVWQELAAAGLRHAERLARRPGRPVAQALSPPGPAVGLHSCRVEAVEPLPAGWQSPLYRVWIAAEQNLVRAESPVLWADNRRLGGLIPAPDGGWVTLVSGTPPALGARVGLGFGPGRVLERMPQGLMAVDE